MANSLSTCPKYCRSCPYNTFLRHFGIHTTWYLQSQTVWLKLCISPIESLLYCKLWAVHSMEAFLFSRNCQTLGVPQQRWGFTHYYYPLHVITHIILDILYVFVHLMPGNALFSVHLLTARHQLIWPSTLIYNRLLNKTHFSLRSMQAMPSSLKSENPNSQYTGYRLFGFHPL